MDDVEKLMSQICQLEKENDAKAKQVFREKLQTLEAKNDELIRNVQQADDEIQICEELTLFL